MSAASKSSAPTPPTPNKGRFALGNAGGPGNPFARQVAELRKALLNAVPVERMCALVDAMVERAQKGDVAAAKLVMQYTLGKPAAAVEPDRVEIDEHKLRAESALPVHVWAPILQHLQARAVNEIAGVTGPGLQAKILEPIDQVLNGEKPTKLSRKAQKALRREMRRRQRAAAPSPNGSNGASKKRPLAGGRRAPNGPSGASRAV